MHIRLSVLLFFCSIFLSGCFELVEEIDLHADGSGTFVFEMNMSQSKTKLSALMALDSAYGIKVPSRETIEQELTRVAKQLSGSPGIGGVVWQKDFDNYIFSLHLNFKTVNNLNIALSGLHKKYAGVKAPPMQDGYHFEGKTFERVNKVEVKKEMEKVSKKDLDLFNTAFVTSVYKFDQTIKQFTNKDAKLSKNGKALMLKLSLPELLNGTKNISNKIELN